MIQVIVYSVATGRVRRVLDPEVVLPNAIAWLNQCGIGVGEARLLYTKQGGGLDDKNAWQVAVNTQTGLNPDVLRADWLCGVDGSNNIVTWLIGDLACGDNIPGLTLVPAPWGADSRWTYNGVTFTAPVTVPGK